MTPSVKLAESILNHPSVRPFVLAGHRGKIDAEQLVQLPNVAVANTEGGLVLFAPLGAGVYDGHIFCVAGSRGAAALRLGKVALQRIFADHRASKVVASVPLALPAARYLCRRLGLVAVSQDLFNEYFEVEAVQWVA